MRKRWWESPQKIKMKINKDIHWLLLQNGVPEYAKYDDIDELTERLTENYYADEETKNSPKYQEVKERLDSMFVGWIAHICGYRVIKCYEVSG